MRLERPAPRRPAHRSDIEEEEMDVRWGTMQDCLGSEKFDIVVVNPPLLPGSQPDSISMAY